MKKALALIFALVMALSVLPAISLAENDFEVNIYFVDEYDLNVTLADPILGHYNAGDVVDFIYPVVEGYTHGSQGMPGTYLVTGSAEIYIKYRPDVHNVTVYYQFTNGEEAAPTYNEEVLYNRPYYVESPVIEHYTADILVVEGTMGTEDVVVTVVYTGEPCEVTIHFVDENGEPIGDDVIVTVPYGEDFEYPAPEIPGYTPDVPAVGGLIEGDTEFTIPYTSVYMPVPPTVNGVKAELRARPTADAMKDLRFIFVVNFNDSYVVYNGKQYGPEYDYYVINSFWSTLATDAKEIEVPGEYIFAMYIDGEGEENMNAYLYTAVLRGVRAKNFDTEVTATPFLTYSMEGESETVTGEIVISSVNDCAN